MTERCVAGTRAAVRENIVTPTGVGVGGGFYFVVFRFRMSRALMDKREGEYMG